MIFKNLLSSNRLKSKAFDKNLTPFHDKNSQQARNRSELLQPVRVSMDILQLISYLIVQI